MGAIIFVGAGSDIAQATLPLIAKDVPVFLLTRDVEQLPEKIKSAYECMQCDPVDLQSVYTCFEKIIKDHKVDAVVNFCGSILLKPAALLTEADWHKTISINLTTAFNVANATTKLIKKDCALIFFSTAAASIGLPNHEAIAAAKAGVEGLSRSIAASYAKQNIRSNVIAPGLIETKLSQAIVKSERGRSYSLSMHGLPRLGQPDDVASILNWLLSPKNNWITGEVIRIDGGLSTLKN